MKTRTHPFPVLSATLAVSLACLGLLTVCCGCATLGEPPPRLGVQAIDSNQFLVDERLVDGDGLARAVRQTGAQAETEIQVQMGAGMSPASLRPAYAALQQAGYYKVLFTAPREATATVNDHPSTATPSTSLPPTGRKSSKKLK